MRDDAVLRRALPLGRGLGRPLLREGDPMGRGWEGNRGRGKKRTEGEREGGW